MDDSLEDSEDEDASLLLEVSSEELCIEDCSLEDFWEDDSSSLESLLDGSSILLSVLLSLFCEELGLFTEPQEIKENRTIELKISLRFPFTTFLLFSWVGKQ